MASRKRGFDMKKINLNLHSHSKQGLTKVFKLLQALQKQV
jgi:hypothetical protein